MKINKIKIFTQDISKERPGDLDLDSTINLWAASHHVRILNVSVSALSYEVAAATEATPSSVQMAMLYAGVTYETESE